VNRQTKRQMAKQGLEGPRAGARKAPTPVAAKERTGPRQYLSEVRGEMRKVAWPTRPEVVNSTIIVIIAVAVLTSLIFGFDYASAKFVLFLYD